MGTTGASRVALARSSVAEAGSAAASTVAAIVRLACAAEATVLALIQSGSAFCARLAASSTAFCAMSAARLAWSFISICTREAVAPPVATVSPSSVGLASGRFLSSHSTMLKLHRQLQRASLDARWEDDVALGLPQRLDDAAALRLEALELLLVRLALGRVLVVVEARVAVVAVEAALVEGEHADVERRVRALAAWTEVALRLDLLHGSAGLAAAAWTSRVLLSIECRSLCSRHLSELTSRIGSM